VTIADGQQLTLPGERTFEVVRAFAPSLVSVADEALVQAMGTYFQLLKLVVEPSGAASLAALLTEKARWRDQRVGVILSGGNVGVDRYSSLLMSQVSL
jgi:threonine dehydratase